MDKELIFYCRNGSRSQAAATIVTDEEITRKTIYHLDGGVMAWEGGTTAGFPRIQLFEDSASPGDTLRTAMDLEKGALNYYSRVHGIYRLIPRHGRSIRRKPCPGGLLGHRPGRKRAYAFIGQGYRRLLA